MTDVHQQVAEPFHRSHRVYTPDNGKASVIRNLKPTKGKVNLQIDNHRAYLVFNSSALGFGDEVIQDFLDNADRTVGQATMFTQEAEAQKFMGYTLGKRAAHLPEDDVIEDLMAAAFILLKLIERY